MEQSNCPGSLCAYPTFVSIGVASTCQDVTAVARENCTIERTGIANEDCTYTKPGGFNISASMSQAVMFGFLHTLFNSSTKPLTSQYGATLLEFGVARLPSETTSWKEGKLIYECKFELSAEEYTGWNVTNGTVYPGSATAYPVSYSEHNPTDGVGMMAWYTASDPAFAHDKRFGINTLDSTHASKIFIAAISADAADQSNRGSQGVQAYLADSVNLALYNSLDIPATMANISSAVSYRMLTGPNATTTDVPVFNQDVVIVIRWAWISLPAALVLFTCLFLLAIVYRTHRAEHLIWKSSLTPLLLSKESYPMSSAGEKPFWTRSYLQTRTAVIVNHLTK